MSKSNEAGRSVNMSEFAKPGPDPMQRPPTLNSNDILNLKAEDFAPDDSPLVKEAKANARPSFQEMVKQTNFYQTTENVLPPEDLDAEMTKTGDLSEVSDDYSSSLDPITERTVAAHQSQLSGMKVGSYLQSGELFVFVDTTNIDAGNSYAAKQAAYEYRFNVNMANAGIEEYGSTSPINKNEKPVSKYFDGTYDGPVYRKIFKLRATLR